MVLISLVCSNLTTKISKIFETCKLFWPASEDFVNSATVFVNSATPRGRGIKALAWLVLMGPCPIPQNIILPPHGVCGGSILWFQI